jgi:hypothetical protein
MANRLDLHKMFEDILGSKNVYFQPPTSVLMKYPAIRYSRSKIENVRAGNSVYKQHNAYEVIVIYKDPDSALPMQVSQLPLCSFDRHYVSDNLYHDVFTLYHL